MRYWGMTKRAIRKRPRDANQLVKLVVDLAVGEVTEHDRAAGKSKSAVDAGRLGGLKGGKARAQALPKKRRVEIAKRAATARWRRGGSGTG